MSVEHVVWATLQKVETPLQKLALMAIADGCSISAASINRHYAHPGWDFETAVQWLLDQQYVKDYDGFKYFNRGTLEAPSWVDEMGEPLTF